LEQRIYGVFPKIRQKGQRSTASRADNEHGSEIGDSEPMQCEYQDMTRKCVIFEIAKK